MNTNLESTNGVTPPRESKPGKRRTGLVIGLGLAIIAAGSFFLFGMKEDKPLVYGKYKAHSDNPDINRFLVFEDMYFDIKADQTIVYHSTINSKPKFHYEGTFTLDEATNTLNIQWKSGKMSNTLKIEKENGNYLIKTSNVDYIKETSKR